MSGGAGPAISITIGHSIWNEERAARPTLLCGALPGTKIAASGIAVTQLVPGCRHGYDPPPRLSRASWAAERREQCPLPSRASTAMYAYTTPDVNGILLPHVEEIRLHTDSLSQLTPEEMTIVCIEVGHCCDGALAEKMADKIAQHEEWLDFLVSKGWTVSYYPIAVTHSGLVTNTATAALRACGVSAAGSVGCRQCRLPAPAQQRRSAALRATPWIMPASLERPVGTCPSGSRTHKWTQVETMFCGEGCPPRYAWRASGLTPVSQLAFQGEGHLPLSLPRVSRHLLLLHSFSPLQSSTPPGSAPTPRCGPPGPKPPSLLPWLAGAPHCRCGQPALATCGTSAR